MYVSAMEILDKLEHKITDILHEVAVLRSDNADLEQKLAGYEKRAAELYSADYVQSLQNKIQALESELTAERETKNNVTKRIEALLTSFNDFTAKN